MKDLFFICNLWYIQLIIKIFFKWFPGNGLSNQNDKLVNGKIPTKPILQFTVTPPKQSGPSEAERKIEALTQQLEEEFEKEEESEYFGKSENTILNIK